MRNLFIFLPCEDYLDALQDTILWRLHPFNVMAQLIFDFICLVAENVSLLYLSRLLGTINDAVPRGCYNLQCDYSQLAKSPPPNRHQGGGTFLNF